MACHEMDLSIEFFCFHLISQLRWCFLVKDLLTKWRERKRCWKLLETTFCVFGKQFFKVFGKFLNLSGFFWKANNFELFLFSFLLIWLYFTNSIIHFLVWIRFLRSKFIKSKLFRLFWVSWPDLFPSLIWCSTWFVNRIFWTISSCLFVNFQWMTFPLFLLIT